MRRAHSAVPDEVAKALHATRDWPGVTGTLASMTRETWSAKHLVS